MGEVINGGKTAGINLLVFVRGVSIGIEARGGSEVVDLCLVIIWGAMRCFGCAVVTSTDLGSLGDSD